MKKFRKLSRAEYGPGPPDLGLGTGRRSDKCTKHPWPHSFSQCSRTRRADLENLELKLEADLTEMA